VRAGASRWTFAGAVLGAASEDAFYLLCAHSSGRNKGSRSLAAAASVAAAGADVHRGALEDLDSLRSGAETADGLIHAAFIHDFSNYAPAAEKDRLAIETLGGALAGSERPLVVTSGTLLLQRLGPLATEEDAPIASFPRK
jgi:hypothetical protein